jgi:AraC family transcriptional regulator
VVDRSYAYDLAAMLSRAADAVRDQQPGLSAEQRSALELWVDRHLLHAPTPADLARVVGLSHDWFSRRFQESYSTSPRLWLARRRLALAAQAIQESEEPIADIAAGCGFSNPSHFARQFRQEYGCSPRTWRGSGSA